MKRDDNEDGEGAFDAANIRIGKWRENKAGISI